ncbi:MAG: amidohydrolase family protein [Bacteroidales bacterium]|nr:amidohydrolase family protein [Bacteroidales bacterium]
MKKVYKAHILYTKDKDHFEVLDNGYVAVDDEGCVTGVSTDLASLGVDVSQRCNTDTDVEIIDFGDKLLIPAMNDLHVHAAQYRNQGIAMDLELMEWLQSYTFPEEMKYADTVYAERMYRRFVHDLWRFGTMRVCTFASIHTESTRVLMHLFRKAGMGALVGKVAMNRNCPEGLSEPVEEMVKGYESLIVETLQETSLPLTAPYPPLVRPIITPRFIPSCTPEMLRACSELASKYQLPVQSHLSENKNEIAMVQELEGTWYGNAYNRYGLFGQTPTVMAHCVFTESEEMELMKRNDVMVAHCPTSNLNVTTGIAPIRQFLDKGVRVGLGSDISGGHNLSIFQVMVYAIQLSKAYYQLHRECPYLTLSEAFWMATKCGGSFFGRVGSFEPGYEFDALVIDDSDLNHDNYSLLERLERYIYMGDDRQIVHRFCRGKEILDNDQY